jgi:adenosine deaminase
MRMSIPSHSPVRHPQSGLFLPNQYQPTRELLARLPKTDLHVHLDGSLRLETILELADQQKVKLPSHDPDKLMAMISADNATSLADYLRAFDITLSVMQTEESLYRTAFELCEDAAKENVWYMEIRYSPMLHMQKGLPLTTIVEAVLAGMRDAKHKYGIRSGLIISALRHTDPKWSLRLAELAVAYKNRGVVGYDLAGAEDGFQARKFAAAFHLMRSNNVNCTAHAGEAFGPESIHQALHDCGAHRIGHGTRLREDGDLLNFVADHRIPLEICLKSNVQTKAVDSLDAHPIQFYHDFGVRVTLNTDNRLITGTTVTDEYLLWVQTFGASISDVREVVINGYKSAFQSYRWRQDMLSRVIKEMDEILDAEARRLGVVAGDGGVVQTKRDRRGTSQRMEEGRAEQLADNPSS